MAPDPQQAFPHPDDTPGEDPRYERAFGGVATPTPESAADRGAQMRAAMLAKMEDDDAAPDNPDPAAPGGPA